MTTHVERVRVTKVWEVDAEIEDRDGILGLLADPTAISAACTEETCHSFQVERIAPTASTAYAEDAKKLCMCGHRLAAHRIVAGGAETPCSECDTCPFWNPQNATFRPRTGATMSCGDWWYAAKGSSPGTATRCPVHGKVTITKVNVPEPAHDSSPRDRDWVLA